MTTAKTGSDAALEFIEKIAAAEKLHDEIERSDVRTQAELFSEATSFHEKVSGLRNHKEVEEFAATLGYKVSRADLDQALKIFINRSLVDDGIPVWVRERVQVAVHD